MAFAYTLKKLREERGIPQRKLAEYLCLTRQAIACYEAGKREPDYSVLKKIADYFNVSVDYLIGMPGYDETDARIIGRNIELIRGKLSYKELSEDIKKKTGVLIYPEMLESHAKGERTPFIGTIRILAQYASIRESFFYKPNTPETLKNEREYFRKQEMSYENEKLPDYFFVPDKELWEWMKSDSSLPYIRLAKEIQEAGLQVSALKPLINSFRYGKTDLP